MNTQQKKQKHGINLSEFDNVKIEELEKYIKEQSDNLLMALHAAITKELNLKDITNTAKLRKKLNPDGRIRCYNAAKNLPGVEVDGKKFIPNRGME